MDIRILLARERGRGPVQAESVAGLKCAQRQFAEKAFCTQQACYCAACCLCSSMLTALVFCSLLVR